MSRQNLCLIGRYIVTTHLNRVELGQGRKGESLGAGMKSKIRRAGLIALEAIGLAVAALLAGAGFVLWRVQSAPVDLGWAAPFVKSAANATAFNGAVARVGAVRIAKAEDAGGYLLTLSDVRLGKRASEARARLPIVNVVVHPSDFFSGRAGPREIHVNGASLRVVRKKDKRVKLDFGEGAGDRARVFQSLTGGAYFRDAFKIATLDDVAITFIDEESGRAWTGRNGAADVRRTERGYMAHLASDFDIGGKFATLAFQSTYDLSTEAITSKLDVSNAPVGDLIAVFFNEKAELLTSPVSGTASVVLDKTGAVLSSGIDLSASGGSLSVGGFKMPVKSLAVAAAFDPKRSEFTIERAHWDAGVGSGTIGGIVSIAAAPKGGVERVGFDLVGDALVVDLPQLLPGPLPVKRLSVAGDYMVAEKKLDVVALSAQSFETTFEGRLSYAKRSSASPEVAAALSVAGTLDPATLLKFWPTELALGARDFIAERMPNGVFSGVEIKVDLKEGGIAPSGALGDDALSIAFRADSATVHYAPGMTPLTNVAGRGLLRGNSFKFVAETARVANVRIESGEVDIPVLMPKGELATFRFVATGNAGDILTVLDQEPLRVLKETKFTPGQFAGPVRAEVEIRRPNLRVAEKRDYQYEGVATFDGLSVSNIVGDASLDGGAGRLDLTTQGMVIVGDAKVAETPVSIEWRQRFFGAGDKTVISVQGEADSAMADLFGVPTRQMVRGTVPFTAKAVGGVDAFRALELTADFTGSTLMSDPLGWIKPQGVPAKGSATFAFEDGATEISTFTLEGDGLSAAGAAAFESSGAVKSFELAKFYLEGAADLSVKGRRDAGALTLDVVGAHLNAASMIRSLIDEGAPQASGKTPLALSARIGKVEFRGGAVYNDAVLSFRRGADRVEAFTLAAEDQGGKTLSISLLDGVTPQGARVVVAKSEDIGQLLAGMFAVSSVKGGYGSLEFAFTPGASEAPRVGALEAHDVRIVKAPLFAKIFAAGSLTGLADLVNGEGIELENARADFSIANGEIRIREARATGPSVGITGEGAFKIGGGREISLKGAVAPAYQVNSFLGKAPVIGDLFVNRKGEGLLALSYEVDGTAGEPRVTVNPLSALAPGVLRRMFEGGKTEEATPTEE